MQVNVEIERRTKALNGGHDTTLRTTARLKPARLSTAVDSARVTTLSTSARAANSNRNGHGNDNTH
jgi:hypothetical protein